MSTEDISWYKEIISDSIKKINKQDQQIKDLTELLDMAEDVIESGSLLDLDNYNSKRESYQQKYHKP